MRWSFGDLRWRFLLPALLLIAIQVLPLALGRRTLYLRDVLNAHLPMKAAQAQAMREGELPLIDELRAGGQPLVGNPNASALYPDNLLFLVGPLHWAHNARFWIHWLVAPLAMFCLARAWGLGDAGAAMAAAAFAFSGYFVSQLSFYNAVAGVALAPLFVALLLRASAAPPPRRGRTVAAIAVVWALLLLAGEPFVALMALVLGATAALVRVGWIAFVRRSPLLLLGGFLGSVVAAPQLVELIRILPLSYRGYRGYSAGSGTVASFDPRQAAEWFLPFLFGRPDRPRLGGFWGQEFFTGAPALFFTLYPGILVLALVAVSGRLRRGDSARLWAWGAIVAGAFVSLGRFNPLVAWVYETSWGSALRYPIRFWLPVAVGGALLAGCGFERSLAARSRGLRTVLLALGGLFTVSWVVLSGRAANVEEWLRGLMPALPPEFATNERVRWAGLCLFSIAIVAALGALFRVARSGPRWAGAGALGLVAFHAASQLLLLRPAVVTDDVAPYLEPSPLLAWIPPEAATVHGHANARDVFGDVKHGALRYPDERALWIERRIHQSLYPLAGALHGRRYELNVAPEDLDSYLTMLAVGVVEDRGDADRLRFLRAWGVDRLILERPLEDQTEAPAEARLLARQEFFGAPTFVYALDDAAPRVARVATIHRAPHVNAAVAILTAPDFDPVSMAVLAGGGPSLVGPAGTATVRLDQREEMVIESSGETPGAVVVQRSYLPLWQASVDDEPAAIRVANLHRMAVEVPAGRHSVRLWIDRRPFQAACAVAGLAVLIVAFLAWRWR